MNNLNYIKDFNYKSFYLKKSYTFFKPLIKIFADQENGKQSFTILDNDATYRINEERHVPRVRSSVQSYPEIQDIVVLDHISREKLIQKMS